MLICFSKKSLSLSKKNMMKKSLIVLFLLLFSFSVFSQERDSTKRVNQALGFSAGHSIGFGITYLYEPSQFGLMFVGGALDNDFNIGISPIYKVTNDDLIDLCLYSGNRIYSTTSYNMGIKKKYYIVADGFGIGFDIHQLQFSLLVFAGVASYYDLAGIWNYGYTLDASFVYRF
jgi:hypothetical protein